MTLLDFIRESNRIEGLHHEPTQDEIAAHVAFLVQRTVTVADLELFVSVVQPNAVLRRRKGQNVRVGLHRPPPGGPEIEAALGALLADVGSSHERAYEAHCRYETLHPFTDGNGRSGRALWLWMMGGIKKASLGFLHHWYYQSLTLGRQAHHQQHLQCHSSHPYAERVQYGTVDRAPTEGRPRGVAMLVQIRDRKALSSLSLGALRAYLGVRGWKDEGPWGSRPGSIFTTDGEANLEILVPTRDTVADYAEALAEAVAVLAIHEDRSQIEVFYDLQGAKSDVEG